MIVEGILIGTLPNFLAIFAGKLGDLSGECVVIFDAQSVRDGGDKVRIIQWFRLVDRNLQSLQVADRFDGRKFKGENNGNNLFKDGLDIMFGYPFRRHFQRFNGSRPSLVTIQGMEHIIVQVFIGNSQTLKQECGGIVILIPFHLGDDLFQGLEEFRAEETALRVNFTKAMPQPFLPIRHRPIGQAEVEIGG